MTRIEFTIVVDVDEDDLRAHVDEHGDEKYPIVADPSEFAWIDLEAAIDLGIAENVEITGFNEVDA